MYLVLPSVALMLQLFYIFPSNFHTIICQVVSYRRLKTKESFKRLALKVVTSLTRSCAHKRLQILKFDLKGYFENWSLSRGGHLHVREVVETGGATV